MIHRVAVWYYWGDWAHTHSGSTYNLALLLLNRTSMHCDNLEFISVQFSRSVVSDSLQPHESQHARPPCPSPTPGVYPNSCASSRWYHPAVSSSVVPFSSCPQSLPASGTFPMSQLFAWGGQGKANGNNKRYDLTPARMAIYHQKDK